jgi:hypothetical protein
MQRGAALRTKAVEFGSGRQGRSAIETAGGGNVLDETGEARPGDIERRTRSLVTGPVIGTIVEALAIAVRVHVPVLSVFAIAVHGEGVLRK